jgi:hypothetical protein
VDGSQIGVGALPYSVRFGGVYRTLPVSYGFLLVDNPYGRKTDETFINQRTSAFRRVDWRWWQLKTRGTR